VQGFFFLLSSFFQSVRADVCETKKKMGLTMAKSTMVLFSILTAQRFNVNTAQCHGNGLSKTTYASSAQGSFEALHWMITVLNMTPAQDSSPANGYGIKIKLVHILLNKQTFEYMISYHLIFMYV
jgi:hypothetical protein